RRARFAHVALGAVRSHHLADLLFLELADEPRGEHERHEHRRDRGGDGAERDVTKDVEKPEPLGRVAQRVEELVNHASLPPRASPPTAITWATSCSATNRPSASCSIAERAPSSRISPSTTTSLRFSCCASSAATLMDERIEAGFAL